ncbi:hypothetical protein [Streptomyces sp. NPDC051546]|uniref:hypothetical protein n=1 Tax=Streptomyces sp. NPDC051546 TaxID=3365655 RepID=UPI0037B7B595
MTIQQITSAQTPSTSYAQAAIPVTYIPAPAFEQPTANTGAGPSPKAVKVMAILIAILSAAIGAFMAYTLLRHVGEGAGMGLGAGGATFLGVVYLVLHIEKELGLM